MHEFLLCTLGIDLPAYKRIQLAVERRIRSRQFSTRDTIESERALAKEQKTAARGGVLTASQLSFLRRHRGKLSDPERHGEAPKPGYLLCHDTYFVGTIKGVWKIHMQSAVDAHCSLGFGELYLSMLPMTAVDVFHDRVLPFCEEHWVEVQHLLTDNVLPSLSSILAKVQNAQGSPCWLAASEGVGLSQAPSTDYGMKLSS